MERHSYDPADKSGFPDDCLIDFDMRLIDLFKEMDKKSLKIKDLIEGEYVRIKELTGKQPSRMELFTYMDDDIYQMTIRYSKDNIFKHYLDFLNGGMNFQIRRPRFTAEREENLSAFWRIRICRRFIRCRFLWLFIIMGMCKCR